MLFLHLNFNNPLTYYVLMTKSLHCKRHILTKEEHVGLIFFRLTSKLTSIGRQASFNFNVKIAVMKSIIAAFRFQAKHFLDQYRDEYSI